jgi:hypothetical protein
MPRAARPEEVVVHDDLTRQRPPAAHAAQQSVAELHVVDDVAGNLDCRGIRDLTDDSIKPQGHVREHLNGWSLAANSWSCRSVRQEHRPRGSTWGRRPDDGTGPRRCSPKRHSTPAASAMASAPTFATPLTRAPDLNGSSAGASAQSAPTAPKDACTRALAAGSLDHVCGRAKATVQLSHSRIRVQKQTVDWSGTFLLFYS